MLADILRALDSMDADDREVVRLAFSHARRDLRGGSGAFDLRREAEMHDAHGLAMYGSYTAPTWCARALRAGGAILRGIADIEAPPVCAAASVRGRLPTMAMGEREIA